MAYKHKISVFWFRRDLRLQDNHGLQHALEGGVPVLPLFIFDRNILEKLEDKNDARLTFIYDEVSRLHKELQEFGSGLMVRHGTPTGSFYRT